MHIHEFRHNNCTYRVMRDENDIPVCYARDDRSEKWDQRMITRWLLEELLRLSALLPGEGLTKEDREIRFGSNKWLKTRI